MTEKYQKLYNSDYYNSHCAQNGYYPYDSPNFHMFFKKIAEFIVKEFNPQSVLDVGCAMGFLVTSLRDLGVEAYGIDISEYAISHVRDDIQKYCKVSSALDPLPEVFPKEFDLVVTIEVAEHLFEEDGIAFINNLCKYSNRVLFSSTPEDIQEATHFNVQPPDYWSILFFRNGFTKSFDWDLSLISPQACFFQKQRITDEALIIKYERAFFRQSDFLRKKDDIISEKDKKIAEINKILQNIYSSRSWKFGSALGKIFSKFFPTGSKRREKNR